MKKIFIIIAICYASMINATSLDELQKALIKNHPITSQKSIIKEISEIERSEILKNLFPQFLLNASAMWKSEAISLPIDNPMISLPEQDKDMEQITLEVNQIIYDAGIHKAQRNTVAKKYQAEIQSVNVSLKNLKEMLTKLYYAVIIQKAQIKIFNLKLSTLEEKEKSAQSAQNLGIRPQKDIWIIQKEILSIKQIIDEKNAKLEYLIDKISILTDKEIPLDEEFLLPKVPAKKSLRPEIPLFRLQKDLMISTSKLTSKKKMPKIFFYAKFGYGKPGLNTFDNDWNDFQIYGVNFVWEVWNWRKYSSQQKILNKKIKLIDAKRKAFEISQEMQKKESQKKITQIKLQLRKDEQIIELNKKISESAENQFKNGTETSSNLIHYINSYYASQIQKNVREIQLNFEEYNLNQNIGVVK